MKYIFALLCLMLVACAIPVPVAAPMSSHVAMAKILKNRVVALVVRNKENQVEAYCSGVWVSKSTILTAQHCVTGDDFVNYVVDSDVHAPGSYESRNYVKVRVATIAKRDEDHDLALLLTSGGTPDHDIAPIYTGEIMQGQGVQCLGQPLGLWFSYSSGEVAAVRVQQGAVGLRMLFVQAAIPISPGSSGGGLFDEEGNLLGITHGSYNEGQMLNLFIHAKYAAALVK